MDKSTKIINELKELGYKVDKFTGAILVPYRSSAPATLINDLNKVQSIIKNYT